MRLMSRLGREYLQVGYYTEQYFPEHNIRFIAVNDGVDTMTGVDESTELAPFRKVSSPLWQSGESSEKMIRTLYSVPLWKNTMHQLANWR